MLTIGKLAALAGISADTLRYYEGEGLISPTGKSESGYRLYEHGAVRRIGFIKHAQQCGFTLAEIRELLTLRSQDSTCCGDIHQRAIEKKLQLEHKIRAMREMSEALDHLIANCAGGSVPLDDCAILAALDTINGVKTPEKSS